MRQYVVLDGKREIGRGPSFASRRAVPLATESTSVVLKARVLASDHAASADRAVDRTNGLVHSADAVAPELRRFASGRCELQVRRSGSFRFRTFSTAGCDS